MKEIITHERFSKNMRTLLKDSEESKRNMHSSNKKQHMSDSELQTELEKKFNELFGPKDESNENE